MRISDWSSDVCSSDLRSGHAVDQADADQEQGGRDQVDGDVVHPRLDAGDPGAVQNQAVGGGQQHPEEDEEIEQVAGDRKSVGKGKSVSERVVLGGRRIIKKKKKKNNTHNSSTK